MKPPTSPTSETLLRERLDRRALLRGAATGATALALAGGEALAAANQPARLTASLPPSNADALLLAPGYRHDVVIRWGEALWRGGESLEPRLLAGPLLTRADAAMKQERQFGTNCDAIASFPLAAGRRIVLSKALRRRRAALAHCATARRAARQASMPAVTTGPIRLRAGLIRQAALRLPPLSRPDLHRA